MSEKRTQEIIHCIRDLSDLLRPYVDKMRGSQSHPYILSWWSNMLTIASLLEYQEVPITQSQKQYLLKQLCGGMGSFSDFSLPEDELGESARNVNRKLSEKRECLFKLLEEK